MPILRPYQVQLEHDIKAAWSRGSRIVMAISATGSGKTVTFTDLLKQERQACAAIAHRRELVSQMSLALARNGVYHRVIGPTSLQRDVAGLHMAELRKNYFDPRALCGVIGIDSLPGLNPSDPWLGQVKMFVGDEGHHFLRDNKWGKGVSLFRNLERGLLVTATGFRADGKGLGSHADGLADELVQGPPMRQLIEMGYLTDYRVICPPSDVDYSDVPVTASGDLSPVKLRAAVHRSTRIVGDVVRHYLQFAAGKVGVTFAVDIEAATELAAAYRAAGVPAEVVSSHTPDMLRARLLRRLADRELLQLVNVDLFGEGFDLPAIEVVSMVRKTESKALFDQQFGRALRLLIEPELAARWDTFADAERRAYIAASCKPRAIILDHVGNVARHLPPDAPRYHTLDRQDRKARSQPTDVVPVKTCLNETCMSVYPALEPRCPFCGYVPTPSSRSAPEFVDGNLIELDEAALRKLRGEVERIDLPPRIPPGLSGPAQQHLRNVHFERQHAQKQLRGAIDLWSGFHKQRELSEAQRYKLFYFTFGLDVYTAMALNKSDAESLAGRISDVLDEQNVIDATVSIVQDARH